MSNQVFTVICMVLISVLSGCNYIPVNDLFDGNANVKTYEKSPEYLSKIRNEANLYAKDVLKCNSNEFMPTKQGIEHAELATPKNLIPLGQEISKKLNDFVYYQNCDLVANAYMACHEGFDKYECVQGYVYDAIAYDKKNIDLIENKKAERIANEKNIETERKKQLAINLENALNNIKTKTGHKQTYDIIMKKWDQKSREQLGERTGFVSVLNSDVESGLYEKILPFAEMEKKASSGVKSDVDCYAQGAVNYKKEIENQKKAYIEKIAGNETKLNADIYWYTSQINERKLKLSKVQQGSKEYAELNKEIDYLNNELVPLNLAQDLIKQREQAAANNVAQQREYQLRQAQQAQAEYQRQQLELQRRQAEAAEDANNPLSLGNQVKSLQDYNNSNRMRTCSKVGGVVTCF